MTIFENIIKLMERLTDGQLEQVKAYILNQLYLTTPNQFEISKCPICGSNHIIRYGIKSHKQRYYCKECNKTFVSTTNTIARKSKHSIKVWSEYISCMLTGMSCRTISRTIGISHKTAFYWRHKVMGSLKTLLDNKLTLKGIIEADETFLPISYKGNHSKDGFIMPRKAHKRGERATKRGLSKEKVCISCMLDNNKSIQAEIAGLGMIQYKQLEKINKVENGSVLVTDKARGYRRYATNHNIELIQLKVDKEYKRGMYNLSRVNAFHSTLKRFLRLFNGVSTKHLSNYLNWHIWLVKSVEKALSARINDMLHSATSTQYMITDFEIHQKEALPLPLMA